LTSAGAPPQTPLGELATLLQIPKLNFRELISKKKRGKIGENGKSKEK